MSDSNQFKYNMSVIYRGILRKTERNKEKINQIKIRMKEEKETSK